MEYNYPFAWLDELVEVWLNPNISTADQAAAEELLRELPSQIRKVECSLKCRAFGLLAPQELEQLISQYAIALKLLRQQLKVYQESYPPGNSFEPLAASVMEQLHVLESRLAQRYPANWPDHLTPTTETLPPVLKMLLRLSADQTGIVARAAYLCGLIDAASLRETFRRIAPYIRTEGMEELSDESLRVHAGQPDQRDLDIAAVLLEEMAAVIRDPARYFASEPAAIDELLTQKLAKS